MLVRRDADGKRQVLHIASGTSDAPTLNLARIRQRGAMLGANEVHVHALARTDDERQLVVCDLRAGQFGALAEEPATRRLRLTRERPSPGRPFAEPIRNR